MKNVIMDLLENKELRESLLNDERLDILDKVKQITTLGNSNCCTVEQVANYYEVGIEAIKSCVKRNKNELINNGLKSIQGQELKSFKGKVQDEPTLKYISKLILFTKRTVLNIGMLLTESKVAEEVRSMLLDNHEQLNDVHEKLLNGEEIKIDKTSPTYFIDKEKSLREQEKLLSDNISKAIIKGDMNEYLKISCQVNKIKEDIITLAKEKEELNKPKIKGYDIFIDTENLLSWDTVAKNLRIGRNTLVRTLREHKILQTDTYEYKGKTYSGEHHNVPYQKYMKYFDVKFTTYNDKRKATTKIKSDGQAYLLKKLQEWELIA